MPMPAKPAPMMIAASGAAEPAVREVSGDNMAGFLGLDGIVRGTRGRNRSRSVVILTVSRCGCADVRHTPRIRSMAFSAIMIVGALVLPPMRVGITDASTMRSLQAAHAQLRVDDGERVVPHPARADRVIHGVGAPPQHVADFIVGVDVRGEQVARGPAGECRRFHQPS